LEENLICEKDSCIGELSFQDFQNCIGGKLCDALEQNEKASEVFLFLRNKIIFINREKTVLLTLLERKQL